jgi:DNA polymerase-2
VLDSRPGIHPYVLVLDFKSLYPSVIRTFGIDPMAFAGAGDEREGHVRSPNGALFRRDDAILPVIIAELMERRDRAKREGDRSTSTALKLLMNSFYGVLGTASCRFAHPAIANAITSFGGEILRRTKREIEEMGYEVLYGDTDSVFVLSRAGGVRGAREVGESIRERVNASLSGWAREEYGRESHLELELERVYRRLFLPHVRGGTEGSKKRYAGLAETEEGTELVLVGLEAVRRDWPEAGKEFQRELLRLVFAGGDAAGYVRSFVRRLRSGDLDAGLVYRKVLRKDPDEYVRAQPPHVRAARAAGKGKGSVVRYVVTRAGPTPVPPEGPSGGWDSDDRLSAAGPPAGGSDPKHPLSADLDYDHYVRKVLEPIADAVLPFLGMRFAEISGDDPQLKLFD